MRLDFRRFLPARPALWRSLRLLLIQLVTVRPYALWRRQLRTSEFWLIMIAIVVGGLAGLATVIQGGLAHGLQGLLFGIGPEERLSAVTVLTLQQVAWLPAGGLVLGLLAWALRRWRPHNLVDVVEANALHGGRLSLIDSAVVCFQTMLSNGVGASVGLEAAYAQAGGVGASAVGQRLKLRRSDLRTLVGAGAGAAIGAAFGAPLTGAFYAFEIVIGAYVPAAIAPVAAAALAGVLASRAVGGAPYSIDVSLHQSPDILQYLLYAALGLICALVGIGIMKLVARVEIMVRDSRIPLVLRPAAGGCILAGLALITPQVLSAGHGALHLDLATQLSLGVLVFLFVLKAAASIVSLGFGFRGGLFFASLFLGSLLGQFYAGALGLGGAGTLLAPEHAALVGMGALAAAVIGGPLTMSFLVLETTGDFGIAATTLAAVVIASTLVRVRFGYSFSTWRLHLRGETIRGAQDVGWARALTAGRMMRRDTETIPASATVEAFRRRFPLGSTSRVIALDETGRYAGLLETARAYGQEAALDAPIGELAINREITLKPDMDIQSIIRVFDNTETEELAVVDPAGMVLGLLAESYVTRRYARELEKAQLNLFGQR